MVTAGQCELWLSEACLHSAGGTQKKILGEPTMMPNWDRDAEVWALGKRLLDHTPACCFVPAHPFSGAEHGSLTAGLFVHCCTAEAGLHSTLRRL